MESLVVFPPSESNNPYIMILMLGDFSIDNSTLRHRYGKVNIVLVQCHFIKDESKLLKGPF